VKGNSPQSVKLEDVVDDAVAEEEEEEVEEREERVIELDTEPEEA